MQCCKSYHAEYLGTDGSLCPIDKENVKGRSQTPCPWRCSVQVMSLAGSQAEAQYQEGSHVEPTKAQPSLLPWWRVLHACALSRLWSDLDYRAAVTKQPIPSLWTGVWSLPMTFFLANLTQWPTSAQISSVVTFATLHNFPLFFK